MTEGEPVNIRGLTAQDWRQLRAARLAALAEAPYAFASTLAREEAFSDETWQERAGSGRTFGAWQDGVVVGLATGFPEESPTGWHLVGMWVAPEYRGQGIADQLVGAVCELAKESGASSVTLWVADVNDRARAFYRRLGFVPTGQRQLLRPGEWEEELSLPV
ncbi:MAG TPA: GNAT family N-acetyltransferase [Streptosporangiaceae bacterium]|nr:GNAT family N-acetyltransferase [Streptosporangiaceae bacterium]